MRKNILIVLLAITTIGLAGFVCYDKVLKKEEKVVCEKCEECEMCPICETVDVEKEDNSFKISTGKEMGISYNDDSFTLFGIGYDNEQEIFISGSKNILNDKIKTAEIKSNIISSGEDECAVIILENGQVYQAYFGHTDNALFYNQIEILKNYKVEKIIEVQTSSEDVRYKVILQDGTIKEISSNE